MGILGELWVKLGLRNEGLNKGLDDSKKKVSGFANYMSKLGGIMAAAFSVKEIVAFTHRTAELANKAAGVRKAFEQLNAPSLLSNLRKATMGTVDDLQLMQRAVQAKNFKIPLNQLATYLEFATKRANETGQSVDYLVDSIITGLGRQSVMILDNLGISAAEIRNNMKDGSTMAEAVGKIIKEQMKESATEIDKAKLATDRLNAAWSNFQITIGTGTSGFWNALKGTTADILTVANTILSNGDLSFMEKLYAIFNPIEGFKMMQKAQDEFVGPKIDPAKLKQIQDQRLAAEEAAAAAAAEAKERKQIITWLKKEIEKKEQIRDISANQEEVLSINEEIAKMKEKLKLLQMSKKELKEYRESQMKNPIKKEDYLKLKGNYVLDSTEFFSQKNLDKGKKSIEAQYAAYIENLRKVREKALEQQKMLDEITEHFNQSVVAGISGGIQELARAIAGVEGANLGTAAQALLTPMADALAAAGEMIIAEGIAVEAFKESLKSLNGPVAIAAGAALVAVAGAVKAGLQAIGNNPTSAGGYASSVTSYSGGYGVNTANYSQSANDYTLVTTLKGQDLLLLIERTQNNKRR